MAAKLLHPLHCLGHRLEMKLYLRAETTGTQQLLARSITSGANARPQQARAHTT